MIRSDIRTFFERLPGLFRNDNSAVMLIIVNIFGIIAGAMLDDQMQGTE